MARENRTNISEEFEAEQAEQRVVEQRRTEELNAVSEIDAPSEPTPSERHADHNDRPPTTSSTAATLRFKAVGQAYRDSATPFSTPAAYFDGQKKTTSENYDSVNKQKLDGNYQQVATKNITNVRKLISESARYDSKVLQNNDDIKRRWANKDFVPERRSYLGEMNPNTVERYSRVGDDGTQPKEIELANNVEEYSEKQNFTATTSQGPRDTTIDRSDNWVKWSEENSTGKGIAGEYLRRVNRLQSITNEKGDELLERFKNRFFVPTASRNNRLDARENHIGGQVLVGKKTGSNWVSPNSPVEPYNSERYNAGGNPSKPKNIQKDIEDGTANYDRFGHSNKYIDKLRSNTGKNNYVRAYARFRSEENFSVGLYSPETGVRNYLWRDASAEGFNIGQISRDSGHGVVVNYSWNQNYNWFNNRLSARDQTKRQLGSYTDNPDTKLEVERHTLGDRVDRAYDSLQPAKIIKNANYDNTLGSTRPPIYFHARWNLHALLEQNALLPPPFSAFTGARTSSSGRLTAGFNTGYTDIEWAFAKLYNRNYDRNASRTAAANSPERASYWFNRGTSEKWKRGRISSIPIDEIEEPRHDRKGNPVPGTGVLKLFKAHAYIERSRGFYSNIVGNVKEVAGLSTNGAGDGTSNTARLITGGGGLLSAIEQLPHTNKRFNTQTGNREGPKVDTEQSLESAVRAEAQHFPFLFETVNRSTNMLTGEMKADTFEQFVYFQATLSQLQEQYTPNWSSVGFSGRTEDVHTYQKGNRTVDMRFIIFANSAREMQNVYERVNWLAQQTYPLYDINPNKMSGGPIIRITVGDLFKQTAGFIRSLSFNWDHLGVNKWEIEQGLRMPMSCEVSMSFQVIHDIMPNRNMDFYSGLSGKMLSGSKDYSADVDFVGTTDAQYDAGVQYDYTTNIIDGRAWNSNTNLIPMKTPTNEAHHETFVSLITRSGLYNTGAGAVTVKSGNQSRNLLPGEAISYADLIRAANSAANTGQAGPTVQVGEGSADFDLGG